MADRKQFNGRVSFADVTEASSKSVAGVEFKGGIAVEKKLHVAGGVTVDSGGCTVTAGGITDNASGGNHRTTLGNVSQAAGVLTSNLDTGILNVPRLTRPAAAGSLATGAHTLTAPNLASGYVVVTANATSVAVTMPAKSVIIALFGGAGKITVGDTIQWHLVNAGTTVNHSLVLTAATGQTVQTNQLVKVAATANDGETATVGGQPIGWFQTRVTNTDGSTDTVRLA
jgi:hypothetical protein